MNLSATLPFLVATLLAAGCSRHAPGTAAPAASLPSTKVRIATVELTPEPEITVVTGLVQPVQRAQLAAKVMGSIEEMPITLGQHVRRGDLVVGISAAEISARVVQAQSQLNAAKRDLDRERTLLTKGASTADMVRGLEDRFAAAEAMVREAQTMLGYTRILAPFDGVISRKMANAGDLASPGLVLLEIQGTSGFQIEAGVPDSISPRLAPDQPVQVEIPASGTAFTGTVVEISSAADLSALTVAVKIAVPPEVAVRSGQFARLLVPGATVAALMVPAQAVSRRGQMERVFVVGPEDRAVLRLVKTGAERQGRTEVLAGLEQRDRVVVDPPAGLNEGQPLQFTP